MYCIYEYRLCDAPVCVSCAPFNSPGLGQRTHTHTGQITYYAEIYNICMLCIWRESKTHHIIISSVLFEQTSSWETTATSSPFGLWRSAKPEDDDDKMNKYKRRINYLPRLELNESNTKHAADDRDSTINVEEERRREKDIFFSVRTLKWFFTSGLCLRLFVCFYAECNVTLLAYVFSIIYMGSSFSWNCAAWLLSRVYVICNVCVSTSHRTFSIFSRTACIPSASQLQSRGVLYFSPLG